MLAYQKIQYYWPLVCSRRAKIVTRLILVHFMALFVLSSVYYYFKSAIWQFLHFSLLQTNAFSMAQDFGFSVSSGTNFDQKNTNCVTPPTW